MTITGPQQGDVLLEQTNDDGEITVEGGIAQMSPGLETSAYLSLFGGNDRDGEYWGNIIEVDPAFKYIAETGDILQAIPATSANLLLIEAAVRRDLQWFLDNNIASSVEVSASIPARNRVAITIDILAQGEESTFNFTENWRASI